MTRLFLPIVLIVAAVGLFVVYTGPKYQNVKTLQVRQAQLDKALTKAKTLRDKRQELAARRNTFRVEDVDKLQKVLPDNVDNIRLIIDINNVASRHGLPISNVKLGNTSDSSSTRSAGAVGSSGDPVGSVTLGFSVTSGYDTFLAFLQDLEHSTRLLNLEQISFKIGATDSNEYSINFRTYWLH